MKRRMCTCVCVCDREREEEREKVYVCMFVRVWQRVKVSVCDWERVCVYVCVWERERVECNSCIRWMSSRFFPSKSFTSSSTLRSNEKGKKTILFFQKILSFSHFVRRRKKNLWVPFQLENKFFFLLWTFFLGGGRGSPVTNQFRVVLVLKHTGTG